MEEKYKVAVFHNTDGIITNFQFVPGYTYEAVKEGDDLVVYMYETVNAEGKYRNMEKSEQIAMLKSLIANIENDHVSIVQVKADDDESTLTLIFNGSPEIF